MVKVDEEATYRSIARCVMAAMLVARKHKIFLLWKLTSIFRQTR